MMDHADLDYILACMDDIKEETEEPIVYKKFLSKTEGNKARGQLPTEIYQDIDTTATVSIMSLDFIQKSNGIYKNGDMDMTIRGLEEPQAQDKILYNKKTFLVKEYSPIHLLETIGYKVRCSKI